MPVTHQNRKITRTSKADDPGFSLQRPANRSRKWFPRLARATPSQSRRIRRLIVIHISSKAQLRGTIWPRKFREPAERLVQNERQVFGSALY